MYITPMLNLKPNKLQFCCIINTTVDWELFAVLIFSMLNFCALYFGHPPTGVGNNSNFFTIPLIFTTWAIGEKLLMVKIS